MRQVQILIPLIFSFLLYSCSNDDGSGCVAETVEQQTEAINSYVASNNLNVQTTASGLRYQITTPGQGDNIAIGDNVELEFVGTLLNGNIFDEGYVSPFQFQTGSFISGFEEGLLLLNEGAEATLVIPAILAFQCSPPANSGIGENQVLVFEVTILSVNCTPQTAEEQAPVIDDYVADNNLTVQTTASGLRYEITTPGDGNNITFGDVVEVDFRGTLLDGTVFDEGTLGPVQMQTGSFIPGFEEGLTLLNEGAEATMILPSIIAYQCSPPVGSIIRTNQILVFEVTVVRVN